jgi:thiol:disulfide interchange protein DsbA
VKKYAALIASAVLASAIAAPAAAQPVEGRDYVVVQPPQPTSDPSHIVVTEFFSHQCPHCFSFYPALNDWVSRLPADVVFERVPVAIGRPTWAPIAKAFYALESMGKLAELDGRIFNAIHAQRVRLDNEAAIADWLATQGVDRAQFTTAMSSFSVSTFATRAEQTARAHRLPSVPTLVVDGKYLVAIGDDGVFTSQLAVVDALIAKARAEKTH